MENTPPKNDLPLSAKVEILVHLIMNKPFVKIIDELSNVEVVALQKFVWDKTVEIGLRLKGKDFTRRDITKRMVSTPTYQRNQKCSERVYYCKGIMCIHSNPTCARNKIGDHLTAMQSAVKEWLEEIKSPKLEEVSLDS
jgi:hypothetical protein